MSTEKSEINIKTYIERYIKITSLHIVYCSRQMNHFVTGQDRVS